MDNLKIFLNNSRSNESFSSPSYLDIRLKGKKRILNGYAYNASVSANDVYNNERQSATKIKLVVTINAVCSNILFNPVTEIIMDEGSPYATSLNYSPQPNGSFMNNGIDPFKGNSLSDNWKWDQYQLIRDTQLSDSRYKLTYHCGIDMFNNHLIRSNTSKTVKFDPVNSTISWSNGERTGNESHVYYDEKFNTIDDWLRDSRGIRVLNNYFNPFDGKYISFNVAVKFKSSKKESTMHFRGYYDIIVTINDPYGIIPDGQHLVQAKCDTRITYGSKKNSHTADESFVSIFNTYGSMANFTSPTTVWQQEFQTLNTYPDKITNIELIPNPSVQVTIDNYDLSLTFTNLSKFIDVRTNTAYDIVYLPDSGAAPDSWRSAAHLYQSYDVDTFDEAITDKLIENNGWFGFKNTSKIPTYIHGMDISKPINSRMAGSFIDMYPERDLFSFVPKFNKYRNRIEKNWDYCITYPSSSTTNVSFISQTTGGLKVRCFDERVVDDNGNDVITIYSVSQHGLMEGDYVNIYSNSELIYGNAVVANVYDKYIFQIYKNGISLSNQWYDLADSSDNIATSFSINDNDGITRTFTQSLTDRLAYIGSDGRTYYATPDTLRLNVDNSRLNLSYKRVTGGMECKYYVRIFSKLPNFKFVDKDINDINLYGDNSTLIHDYSDKKNDFSNHINSLAFAKNIYGDRIAEIVYTDDIDLKALKDNLGRPLTNIYLTVIKRNAGYKEWYGVNHEKYNLNSENIEFSHCFGKNSTAFILSEDSIHMDGYSDARTIGYGLNQGLNMSSINDKTSRNGDDEVIFDTDRNFYGDLCCYSPMDADEQIIQGVFDRFNTAQRDLTPNDTSYSAFSTVNYDEITGDETSQGFNDTYNQAHSTKYTRTVLPRREGYIYKMHYQIPIKTISSDLSYSDPLINDVVYWKNLNDNIIRLSVKNGINYGINHKAYLYNKNENAIYRLKIKNITGDHTFTAYVYDNNGKDTTLGTLVPSSALTIVDRDDTTPEYAELIKDGSCSFRWREVIQNGYDDNSNVENYPFTNGALYIHRYLNLYLRRQDPHGDFGLSIPNNSTNILPYEKEGETPSTNTSENNYISANNMKEC